MDAPAYRVDLELFSGPLDLLLYLVRRDEVPILRLPIARITRQFQEFLAVLQEIDLALAGDFVVLASTLLEIKSRMVLPDGDDAEEEPPLGDGRQDPRSELIEQLLQYQRFKEAAAALEARADEWGERYPRLEQDRPVGGKNASADRIREVELWDLVSALARVLRRKDVEEEGRIRYDETPISVFVEQIGQRVRAERTVWFSQLFDAETARSRIIGMFLAILELLRHHGFRAEQSADFGDILLRPPDDVPSPN